MSEIDLKKELTAIFKSACDTALEEISAGKLNGSRRLRMLDVMDKADASSRNAISDVRRLMALADGHYEAKEINYFLTRLHGDFAQLSTEILERVGER